MRARSPDSVFVLRPPHSGQSLLELSESEAAGRRWASLAVPPGCLISVRALRGCTHTCTDVACFLDEHICRRPPSTPQTKTGTPPPPTSCPLPSYIWPSHMSSSSLFGSACQGQMEVNHSELLPRTLPPAVVFPAPPLSLRGLAWSYLPNILRADVHGGEPARAFSHMTSQSGFFYFWIDA